MMLLCSSIPRSVFLVLSKVHVKKARDACAEVEFDSGVASARVAVAALLLCCGRIGLTVPPQPLRDEALCR